jgi:hypothetical protein
MIGPGQGEPGQIPSHCSQRHAQRRGAGPRCWIMDLSCSKYSGSQGRRREGKKRNSIKSSKLIGLLAKVA